MTDPMESLAQRVAEGVFDLLVNALDVNALVRRVDLNAADIGATHVPVPSAAGEASRASSGDR